VPVDIAGDTEIETLLFESLDSSIPCSFPECDSDATHILVCGACFQGREFMCGPHTEIVQQIKTIAPTELIIFDQTCGQTPEYGNCHIEPIPS
jgi:hypothetical protein